MFTGLVQDVGVVRAVLPESGAVHLHLETRLAQLLADGDSLAVNGVCLTITSTRAGTAVATAVPETLDLTNLGRLAPGSHVNLEPALRLGDRLGGHLVQGHVDGMGTLSKRSERGLSLELTFAAEPEILRYAAHKGSICIDGVSLTIASLAQREFSVALVPHTLGNTTLQGMTPGQRVNLESDLLAKYVERLLMGEKPKGGGSGEREGDGEGGGEGRMSEEWLRKLGFA